MNVRIASEAWICRSFVRTSESTLWILIWIWSWDPLRLCDAIRRTTPAPPGQNPGRARPRSAHSPLQSHHSNAPIEPVSQSILSKIVALLAAIMPSVRSVRIAIPLGRSLHLGPPSGAERLNLSGDPVDQTCGIQQRGCLIEELLDVESDFKTLLMKARTGAGIGCAPYSRGLSSQLRISARYVPIVASTKSASIGVNSFADA